MELRSRATVVAGLLAAGSAAAVAALILVGPSVIANPVPVATAIPAAARTSFPGLIPAAGEPELASVTAAHPRRGQILQVSGPFDDRFVLEDTTFRGSAVSGAVRITSDVSDVLELQVLAGFYDLDGRLLGTNRFVHHFGAGDHPHAGVPQLRERFSVQVPAAMADRVASVALGVPVLVNE